MEHSKLLKLLGSSLVAYTEVALTCHLLAMHILYFIIANNGRMY